MCELIAMIRLRLDQNYDILCRHCQSARCEESTGCREWRKEQPVLEVKGMLPGQVKWYQDQKTKKISESGMIVTSYPEKKMFWETRERKLEDHRNKKYLRANLNHFVKLLLIKVWGRQVSRRQKSKHVVQGIRFGLKGIFTPFTFDYLIHEEKKSN